MCAKIKSLPRSSGHKYRPKGVSTREFHSVHWPYIPVWAVLSAGAAVAGAAEFGAMGAMVGGVSMTLATIIVIL